jgi:hypothetical protein
VEYKIIIIIDMIIGLNCSSQVTGCSDLSLDCRESYFYNLLPWRKVSEGVLKNNANKALPELKEKT